MARSARDQPAKQPDNRQPQRVPVEDERLAKRMATASTSAVPIRTLVLMEVGDLPPLEVLNAMTAVQQMHKQSGHPTFILPVRDGKLKGDVLFEKEVLRFVNMVCEVGRDGAIAMRNGYQEVDVMRTNL